MAGNLEQLTAQLTASFGIAELQRIHLACLGIAGGPNELAQAAEAAITRLELDEALRSGRLQLPTP